MILYFVVALLAASVWPILSSAQSIARYRVDIPAQELGVALAIFAKQTRTQVVYASTLVEGKFSPAIGGLMSPKEALEQLLLRSGLVFQFIDSETVTLSAVASHDARSGKAGMPFVFNPTRVLDGDAGTMPGSLLASSPQSETLVGSRNLCLSGLCVALIGTNVLAADENQLLEELVVVAGREVGTTVGSKTDTPIVETPQSITVVSRIEMDARGVQSVNEALRYSAGVQSEQGGMNSRADDIVIRGFSAGTETNNLYIDGLRRPSGGSWTHPIFDAFSLERVEVLKGPSGVLYGQVAPGGLVNLVSKQPSMTPRTAFTLGAQSYDTWQGTLDINRPLSDTVAVRLVALNRDGEAAVDTVKLQRRFVAPSLTWRPTENTRLTLLSQFQRDDGGATFQYLPLTGTMRPGAEGYIGHSTFLGEPEWNTYDREQWSIGYQFDHAFNSIWSVRQNFRFMSVETLYRAVVSFGDTQPDGRTLRRRVVQGDGVSEGYAVDTSVQARFSTRGVEHTLIAGIDYLASEYDFLRQGTSVIPTIDIFHPVYGGRSSIGPLTVAISEEMAGSQLGFYLQDQMAIDRWRLTLSVRRDDAEDDLLDRRGNARTTTEANDTTYRAGALYLLDNGLAPYASYSTSFEPATGTDFFGNLFEPTTGEQVEVGVKYQPPGHNALVTLSAYELTQQNITTPDPDPTHLCGTVLCQVQTGEGRVRGIELEGKMQLTSGLSVLGTYTYMESKVTRSNGSDLGMRLTGIPKDMYSLFVDYTFIDGPASGLGFGVGVRDVGESAGNSVNTILIPGYTVYDMALRYELGKLSPELERWKLWFNVHNVTDDVYVGFCASATTCKYGARRNFTASVRYAW